MANRILANLITIILLFIASNCFADESELMSELQQKVLPGINCILTGTGLQYAMTGQLKLPDVETLGNSPYTQCNKSYFSEDFSNNVFSFTIKTNNTVLHEINRLILTATPTLSGGSIKSWDYGGTIAERFNLTGPGLLSLTIIEEMPEIGDRLPKDAIPMNGSVIAVTNSKQEKGYYLKRDGNLFMVAANENKLITFISAPETFSTPEGIKLKDPVHKVLEKSNSELISESEHVQVIILPSGWYAKIANNRVFQIFKSKYVEQ